MFGRISVAVTVVALAGCTQDLEIPPPPPSTTVVGAVDTNPADTMVSPGGVSVQLIDTEGIKRNTLTDADGGFQHLDVKPGLYALEVNAPAHATLIVPNVRV